MDTVLQILKYMFKGRDTWGSTRRTCRTARARPTTRQVGIGFIREESQPTDLVGAINLLPTRSCEIRGSVAGRGHPWQRHLYSTEWGQVGEWEIEVARQISLCP